MTNLSNIDDNWIKMLIILYQNIDNYFNVQLKAKEFFITDPYIGVLRNRDKWQAFLSKGSIKNNTFTYK